MPGSVAEALGMMDTCLDYLNGPGGEAVDGAAAGGVPEALAGTGAKHSAAWMRFLAHRLQRQHPVADPPRGP
jgi:hypothetical protein